MEMSTHMHARVCGFAHERACMPDPGNSPLSVTFFFFQSLFVCVPCLLCMSTVVCEIRVCVCGYVFVWVGVFWCVCVCVCVCVCECV